MPKLFVRLRGKKLRMLKKQIVALLPSSEQQLEVVHQFLQLSADRREHLVRDLENRWTTSEQSQPSPVVPVDVNQTLVYRQMRQIVDWFQSSCSEWKNVPHARKQELSGAVKRRELQPAEWKQRMQAIIQSDDLLVASDVKAKQQRKMLRDLDQRIAKKKELAQQLQPAVALPTAVKAHKRPATTPDNPPKRQRKPCDDPFVNASVALLRWLYRSHAMALKKLQRQENNALLAHEEHFSTLVVSQMNVELRTSAECDKVHKETVWLLQDAAGEEKFAEFESELTSLEADSLYRRLRSVHFSLADLQETLRSAKN